MSAVTQTTPDFPNVSFRDVAALSDLYAEPDWMRAARRDAWALAQEMPLPHQKEEAWRRTPLHRFPLDSLRVALAAREREAAAYAAKLDDLPPCWHHNMAPENLVSGTLVHCNDANSYQTMRPEDQTMRLEDQTMRLEDQTMRLEDQTMRLEDQTMRSEDVRSGVIFDNLHRALHTHGDLIRRYWMQGRTTRPDFNKFTALHAALWHGGTFVYVPAGARVSRPLQSLVAYDADSGSGLHHTLIIAEKGSRVSLIQDRVSQERRPELNLEMVEIYAEEGAFVRYASFQHWGENRYALSVQEANLAQNANFVWVNGALGGRMSKDFLTTSLNAPGARAQMHGYAFAVGDQHVDQSTYQHHRAPNTYSNLLYRNVLRDQARTVFYGMIRAEQESAGMEGYQANNNILLGDAHAHSIPGLEIRCNDVRCSHGSTLSRIDPEQLFYLQARGLPTRDAEGLIVQGFLRSAVERVPLAYMRDRLEEEILQRFWSSYV